MGKYKKVVVTAGSGGWGGPVEIEPSDEKPYIASFAGMQVHPLAKEIAKLTGGETVNIFMKSIPVEKMACVVIDCAGSNRAGRYPVMGVKTVNVFPVSPMGGNGINAEEASRITPDLLVTGVKNAKFVKVVED